MLGQICKTLVTSGNSIAITYGVHSYTTAPRFKIKSGPAVACGSTHSAREIFADYLSFFGCLPCTVSPAHAAPVIKEPVTEGARSCGIPPLLKTAPAPTNDAAITASGKALH